MKKYLTSVIAIHNINGQLGKWPGPIIEANSLEEADEWCKKNTQYVVLLVFQYWTWKAHLPEFLNCL